VRARRLSTRRGEFAVLDAAPAGPAVGTALLVPGFTGSKEDFIALLGPLTDAGYRTVAVDGRGQYQTPGAGHRSGYRLGALAEDVLAQAAALDGEVHLLGHSLGGLISRGAVLRDAGPFRSLTLLSSGPGRLARGPRWRVRLLARGLPVLGQRAVWRLTNPRPGAPGDEVHGFLERRWLATDPGQLRGTGRTLRYEPDRVGLLAASGVPVHVVSGERDGAWPVEWMDDMARRLGAGRTVIKGAEHSPNAEQPAATAAALLDFWSTLDAAGPPSGTSSG
jgi:pimeloyl-ACP methyl ester carboxylesterase